MIQSLQTLGAFLFPIGLNVPRACALVASPIGGSRKGAEQAEYLGIGKEGPFKPEHYRY